MLSKSDLQAYLQCSRKLWIERHRPALAEPGDTMTRCRETDGNLVGEFARAQLGENFIWPAGHDETAVAAQEAKRLLGRSPHLSAAEVPMAYRGLYARADALVADAAGYVLRETKASSFPLKSDKVTPGEPEPHHLDDVAIQAWVMGEGGASSRCFWRGLVRDRPWRRALRHGRTAAH